MKRHWISTLIAMLFVIMVITGIMGFFLPFNILTVSVHAFVGFAFTASIVFHIKNNWRSLRGYFTKRSAWVLLLSVAAFIGVILWQPAPIKAILGLSSNLGPDPSRFEIDGQRMLYRYDPAPHYRMQLEVIGGSAYDADDPPVVAIWIENRSGYHIKSLYHSEQDGYETQLAYWHYKRSEYLKYKLEQEALTETERQAKQDADLDAISSATENDSFDPADYIVPKDAQRDAPYRVLIEINQPSDANEHHEDQPSLVYSVEVDNRDPRTFQVLEIVGYPQREEEDGQPQWSLYYADETMTTARDLLDSALLRITRAEPATKK
ncbi:MAG: DUF4405 domain-containing protein [Phycisphaeraceae bacterium]